VLLPLLPLMLPVSSLLLFQLPPLCMGMRTGQLVLRSRLAGSDTLPAEGSIRVWPASGCCWIPHGTALGAAKALTPALSAVFAVG
jgi:hypothetical protein